MKKIYLVIFIVLTAMISYKAYAYSPIGYFSDRTPPEVSTSIMEGKRYSGTINVQFDITDEATSVKSVKVFLDDIDITQNVKFASHKRRNRVLINTDQLTDGKHFLTIIARDSSLAKNSKIEEVSFIADNTPPLLKLASGGGSFKQGSTAYLYFIPSEPGVEIEGAFQSKEFKAYPYKGKYRAVIGFSIDDPGNKNYYMKIKVKDRAGNESDYHYKVYVGKNKYGKLSFTLKPKKVEMLMPDTIREDWKKIEDVVVQENPSKYYRGRFITPTVGRISMTFGLKEFINGSESGRHRGLDYANKEGTPIRASNYGIVKLAERLPAHGNTVVIDHGQGIYTYYAHMSRICVNPGDKVLQGQKVGEMGATGVASGPHLHFAMSLHNLRVDPMQWLNGVIVD